MLATGFITIIGYFDEGHANIYGSFSNYLASGGYPPLSDYLMWSIITAMSRGILFNIISKLTRQSFPLPTRLHLYSYPNSICYPHISVHFFVFSLCLQNIFISHNIIMSC
ncbi:MAG: hypothetical protein ACI94Y_004023 [Maribacter sp.]|jgi:hypothetical protein